MSKLTILVGLIFAGASLSACNRDEGDALVLDARTDAERPEDKFGEGFGEAFRADPNSEPAPVRDGDVKPVSHTAQPEPIE